MKKKLLVTLISCMCILSFSACGKKSGSTVSDNIANATGEITGLDEINAQLSSNNADVNYLSDEGEGSAENLEDMMSEEAVSDDNVVYMDQVTVDEEGNIVPIEGAEESVSDSDLSDETAVNEGNVTEPEENSESKAALSEYMEMMAVNNALSVANLSGKDLKEVYASFNGGSFNNIEITSGKKLKDGNKLSYAIADIESIANESNIILSISAVDKAGNTISFGDVRIIDISSMNVVLSKNSEGYYMYIK